MQSILYVYLGLFLYNQDILKCNAYFDTLLNRNIYTYVDEKPTYSESAHKINQVLLKNIELKDNDIYMTAIRLAFIIDTVGNIMHARIINKQIDEYNEVEKQIINNVNYLTHWKPASCNGKVVYFLYKWHINIHIDNK